MGYNLANFNEQKSQKWELAKPKSAAPGLSQTQIVYIATGIIASIILTYMACQIHQYLKNKYGQKANEEAMNEIAEYKKSADGLTHT